jgi:hypothetical protein
VNGAGHQRYHPEDDAHTHDDGHLHEDDDTHAHVDDGSGGCGAICICGQCDPAPDESQTSPDMAEAGLWPADPAPEPEPDTPHILLTVEDEGEEPFDYAALFNQPPLSEHDGGQGPDDDDDDLSDFDMMM